MEPKKFRAPFLPPEETWKRADVVREKYPAGKALVYEMFFPEALQAAGLHFFDLCVASPALISPLPENPLRLYWNHDQFKHMRAPGHPLRVALDKLETLDLVRIIEGHA
jgi:hypothetical protein